MTTVLPVVDHLPTARPPGRPFDPPDELAALRARSPMSPMRYPDGHLGWLATGHREVRAILADRRFSSRYELMHFPMAGIDLGGHDAAPPAPLGDLTGIDPPEHTRFRRLLTGWFTARRIAVLGERVAEIAADLLDDLERAGGPADLVAAFAAPLPARVICELLGVPFADRAVFTAHALTLTDLAASFEDRAGAHTAIHAYLRDLVTTKRASPTDDLLGTLTASDLTDDELAGIGAFLLVAGLDTTGNMLTLGTFALLEHPDQLALLRADPAGTVDGAVDELMRWLTIAHTNVRAALTDVEVGGHVVEAGQTVTLALQTANRDPRAFADPDTLDLRRRAAGQMAFGHGIHQCLGQHLARVEMRVAFPALVTRFPRLRLAVPAEAVPLRPDANLYGARELPVAFS